jgi:hypothetical protein
MAGSGVIVTSTPRPTQAAVYPAIPPGNRRPPGSSDDAVVLPSHLLVVVAVVIAGRGLAEREPRSQPHQCLT